MTTKSFLLQLPTQKIYLMDFYCKSKGIPRVSLFRQFLDGRVQEHQAEIKNLSESITQDINTNLYPLTPSTHEQH